MKRINFSNIALLIASMLSLAGHAEECSVERERYARKLDEHESPVYPPQALQNNQIGTVTLELAVDLTGTVIDAKDPLSEITSPLTKAAISAVKKWRYFPSLRPEKDFIDIEWVSFDFRIENGRGVVIHDAKDDNWGLNMAYIDGPPPVMLLTKVEPVIPPALAKTLPADAKVIAEMQINSSGRVVHACIHRTDMVALNEPAIKALRQRRYRVLRSLRGSVFPIFKVVSLTFTTRPAKTSAAKVPPGG